MTSAHTLRVLRVSTVRLVLQYRLYETLVYWPWKSKAFLKYHPCRIIQQRGTKICKYLIHAPPHTHTYTHRCAFTNYPCSYMSRRHFSSLQYFIPSYIFVGMFVIVVLLLQRCEGREQMEDKTREQYISR